MSMRLEPADIVSAVRLRSRVGEFGVASTAKNPWKGIIHLRFRYGRLHLTSTDGTYRLDGSIPVADSSADGVEMCLAADMFDSLAVSPIDNLPYEMGIDDGLVLRQGDRRRITLPALPHVDFPPRALDDGPDVPGRPSQRWPMLAAPLADALKFVVPFIDADHPDESRSVATLTSEGALIGGNPRKAAVIRGLPRPSTPMSFNRRSARLVATFLEQVACDVEVRVSESHFTFSCPGSGYVLEVRGEPANFPGQSLFGASTGLELFSVDRMTLLSSISILEIFLPTRDGIIHVELRGRGEDASVFLSTPGGPATCSHDEIPIIRQRCEDPPGHAVDRGAGAVQRPPVMRFWVGARAFREALARMEAITLTCHLDTKARRIRLEEQRTPGRPVRSVILSILNPEVVEPGGSNALPLTNDRAGESVSIPVQEEVRPNANGAS